MNRAIYFLFFHIAAVPYALVACNGDESSAVITEDGGAAGYSNLDEGGAGGERAGNGGAGTCTEDYVIHLGVCTAPVLQVTAGSEVMLEDLSVLEVFSSNASICNEGAYYPSWQGADSFEGVTAPWVAVRLENDLHESWIVQFSVPGFHIDSLSTEEKVDLRVMNPTRGSAFHRGYVSLERAGSPIVFVAYGEAPAFSNGPTISVEPSEPMCEGQARCFAPTIMRLSVDGTEEMLTTGESIEIDSLLFTNDVYVDSSECGAAGVVDAESYYVLAGAVRN